MKSKTTYGSYGN